VVNNYVYAVVKVKSLSPYASNEILKKTFEHCFGRVLRTTVITDSQGKGTGEAIIEFQGKLSAQKCLQKCTGGCFFFTR
jgi:hypothetical protein